LSKVDELPVRLGSENFWTTGQQLRSVGHRGCDSERARICHGKTRLQPSGGENSFLARKIEIHYAPQFADDATRVLSTDSALKDIRDFAEVDPAHDRTIRKS